MNKIYRIENGVVVPDGTTVYEIIGPIQSKLARLPIIDAESLAYGELDPGEKSHVHVHPIITHLTWVVSGTLTVGMKDAASNDMYYIEVKERETVLTQPGTFFQLINNSDKQCQVLYIVAPAFIFEVNEQGEVLYNDQIVLDLSWDQLRQQHWQIPELQDIAKITAAREASLQRLKQK
ncbi:cupin domain-containing protein [Chitinophaga sp. G-6-1-13]|uniref:Cupin domain-containing protein n=1 Tax=Chitinophaga fulva TaxID=2728842 RepID=A0A848GQQ8_9BACT|nr:cupin domain-containing protein [Chitinophaga fulva]NML39689.1 cupin domain-containing protein [Chitinophaga fulva]